MDLERLIGLVRKHPILFDKSDRNYKNRLANKKIWDSIAKEMGADSELCFRTWRILKHKYENYLKKTNTDMDFTLIKRNLNQLDFLKQYFKIKAPAGDNVRDESGNDSNLPTLPVPLTLDTDFSVASATQAASVDNFTQIQAASHHPQDPVDAFLNSLAHPLKSLSPYLFHLAKSELFNAVQKYELKMLKPDEERASPNMPDSYERTTAGCGEPDEFSLPSVSTGFASLNMPDEDLYQHPLVSVASTVIATQEQSTTVDDTTNHSIKTETSSI